MFSNCLLSDRLRQSGFSYLGLMFIVAAMGAVLGATGTLWSTTVKREREAELLWVGEQYRRAIEAYRTGSPGSLKEHPKTLAQLLKDQRQLATKRYLRRIYPDPVTNSYAWSLLRDPDGGIVAVYSLSEAKPMKKANFSKNDKAFELATKYSDWKFMPPKQAVPIDTGQAATLNRTIGQEAAFSQAPVSSTAR